MARRQLINRYCNSPDAVFRTIRDFLSASDGIDDFSLTGDNPGPGYEIIDSSYTSGDPGNTTSGDWFVLRSYGEGNTYPVYLYFEFGAQYHTMRPYLHWDPEAHAGRLGVNSTNNVYHNGAGDVIVYIYADLIAVDVVIKPRAVTNYYWNVCGRINESDTLYDGSVAQSSIEIPAGDNVAVSLPFLPTWARVGAKIYCWGTNQSGVWTISELSISGIDAQTSTITVSNDVNYQSGAYMTEDLTIYCNAGGQHNVGTTSSFTCFPGRGNVSAQSPGNAVVPGISGKDGKYGDRFACDIWLNGTAELRGILSNVRLTRETVSTQGQAWVDQDGIPWRLHTVHSGVPLAFREAV